MVDIAIFSNYSPADYKKNVVSLNLIDHRTRSVSVVLAVTLLNPFRLY